jgi:ribulose-phosphate 3-epimerase
MAEKLLIAPSILSADFSRLGEEVENVTKAGADWIHIDVMDGVFVPNITMGPCIVKSVRNRTNLPFDVHLMIENPGNYVKLFADAGADIITFHIEACKNPLQTIFSIKELKKKIGVSIRPNTPISSIAPYLGDIDMVLVMTVEPGFGGQSFMPGVVPKIEGVKKIFNKDIEVDGGINFKNVKEVVRAGANIIVAGTSVFGEKNYKEAIRRLKSE